MSPRFSAFVVLAVLAAPLAAHAAESKPAAASTATTSVASSAASLGASLSSAFGVLLDSANSGDRSTLGLPDKLAKIQAAAKAAGKSELVDQLAAKLNSSSESSFTPALGLVKSALSDVPWSEAKNLASGGKTAVTDFIRKSTATKLRAQLLPTVQKAVAAAGVPDQYKQLLSAVGPAASLFGKPGVSDLESFVTDQTLESVYAYLAKEETALRANPALAQNPLVKQAFALLSPAK